MVDKSNLAYKFQEIEKEIDYTYLPDPLKFTSISLTEVFNNKLRLEASAFSLQARKAREKLKKCKNGASQLFPNPSFVVNAFHAPRFKRQYVQSTVPNSVGFLGSAEMLNTKPNPIKFIPNEQALKNRLYVKKETILISCSGTIGNTTFVNRTLEKYAFSQHIIRLICREYPGYIYAFLNTSEAQAQIQSLTYGAVIPEIEPHHLENVIIPNAPKPLKKEIHELIIKSFDLRDESNDLIDKAQQNLYSELQLKPIEDLKAEYFDSSIDLRNYSTKLSDLHLRLEASFHVPSTQAILKAIKQHAKEVTNIGDKRISSNIILPGRFKRIYVEKHNGIPFFGGKQLLELNPSNIKYLSLDQHSKRISEQLFLKENMIAVTCSGTIGKVNIIPKHWENWTLNQHVMRIVPSNPDIAGYVFCWLNTEFGHRLITRHTYGSVVDEIDDRHLSQVEIPLLKDEQKQKLINDLVLKANELRHEAHLKEQKAIEKIKEIINSTVNTN
ncbi:restriction endonuclease subunit S [Flagellimonas sp.]|uniref:restriction endonuclease subunit S n=1 Tax=Flagellimonas sp. TaxID=2058762 RepID=UPI003AB14724